MSNHKEDARWNALRQQQMTEHQAVISSHHKEMQGLRESIKIALEKVDGLFQKSEIQVKDQSSSMESQISDLKTKCKFHEEMLVQQKKNIEFLNNQIEELHSIFVKKTEIEEFKKEIRDSVNQSTILHINSFQQLEREFKRIIYRIQEDLEITKIDLKLSCESLHHKIDEKSLHMKIDKEGLSREIRIYEKTIFIIEKKIENLYTLIDRLKRGEECPKQES